jgi:hypothetical protein
VNAEAVPEVPAKIVPADGVMYATVPVPLPFKIAPDVRVVCPVPPYAAPRGSEIALAMSAAVRARNCGTAFAPLVGPART